MKSHIIRKAITVILAVIIACLLLLGALGVTAQYLCVWRPRQALEGVQVGWTREQVIQKLGKPESIARSPEDFINFGDNELPKRHINKEVLQYTSLPWVLYIYVGHNDKVTYVFMSRT